MIVAIAMMIRFIVVAGVNEHIIGYLCKDTKKPRHNQATHAREAWHRAAADIVTCSHAIEHRGLIFVSRQLPIEATVIIFSPAQAYSDSIQNLLFQMDSIVSVCITFLQYFADLLNLQVLS